MKKVSLKPVTRMLETWHLPMLRSASPPTSLEDRNPLYNKTTRQHGLKTYEWKSRPSSPVLAGAPTPWPSLPSTKTYVCKTKLLVSPVVSVFTEFSSDSTFLRSLRRCCSPCSPAKTLSKARYEVCCCEATYEWVSFRSLRTISGKYSSPLLQVIPTYA
jgi:hypothetical protein